MVDFPKQIASVQAETQEAWYEFLKAELRTYFTAIDFGTTELDLGDGEVAASKVRGAEKGYAALLRFLPE